MRVGQKVGGNNRVLGVIEDALHRCLRSLLDGGADLVIRGGFSQIDRQVDNGNVQCRNAERHTGQLAVELRDNLADSLRSAGRGGDDVPRSGAAASPVFLGRTVNRFLSSGG